MTQIQEVPIHVDEELEQREKLSLEEEVMLCDETRIAGIAWTSLKRSALKDDY